MGGGWWTEDGVDQEPRQRRGCHFLQPASLHLGRGPGFHRWNNHPRGCHSHQRWRIGLPSVIAAVTRQGFHQEG